jgi:hypothetical protein
MKNPKILQQICNPEEPKISVAINSTSRRNKLSTEDSSGENRHTRAAANGSAQQEESLRSDCTRSKW